VCISCLAFGCLISPLPDLVFSAAQHLSRLTLEAVPEHSIFVNKAINIETCSSVTTENYIYAKIANFCLGYEYNCFFLSSSTAVSMPRSANKLNDCYVVSKALKVSVGSYTSMMLASTWKQHTSTSWPLSSQYAGNMGDMSF
jgi:hypothetical protein